MAKLELSRVAGLYVESIKADKEYENGQFVGMGDLVEGEDRLYEAAPATADNHYLVSTPEVTFGEENKGWDYTNAEGEVMRAHQLIKGDTVTVEIALHTEGLKAGDVVDVAEGKLAVAEDGAYKIDKVRTLGADRRPAYQVRKIK